VYRFLSPCQIQNSINREHFQEIASSRPRLNVFINNFIREASSAQKTGQAGIAANKP
jgi:hypothetical protein